MGQEEKQANSEYEGVMGLSISFIFQSFVIWFFSY